MPIKSTITLLFCLACSTSFALDDGIPESRLSTLKRATVFIKLVTTRGVASGSGFLFKSKASTGYIVTNQHVIEPHLKRGLPITVVFNSGQGTEKSVRAKLVAADKDRDLALLSVTSAGLPQPISGQSDKKARETMPVFILGFPFGRALSDNNANPAITIGRGSVSSIRKDKWGQIARLQIDGDINPGNSGGPIVDKDGKLVGISVATVLGTNIGFAIPPVSLEKFFEGRIKSTNFQVIETKERQAKVKLSVSTIDPFDKIKGISILWIKKSQLSTRLEDLIKTLDIKPMRGLGLKELQLSKVGNSYHVEFDSIGKTGQRIEFAFQVKFRLASGKARYTSAASKFIQYKQAAVASGRNRPNSGSPPPSTAGDDWLGGGKESSKPATSNRVAERSVVNLLGQPRTVVDIQIAKVELGKERTLPCVEWSKDGQRIYLLTPEGNLRSVRTSTFKQERILKIGSDCSWMSQSRHGLLVAVSGLQEIWVVDSFNLRVKRKIPCASVGRVASSPVSNVAYATSKGQHNSELFVIDLNRGQIVSKLTDREVWHKNKDRIIKHKNGVVLSSFRMITATPDGRYLYSVGFECLHQFRVSGSRLKYEQMGPRIGSNPSRIDISPDSRYLCLPSGGGNGSPSGHPAGGSYHTFIYRVGDLQKPVVKISSGAYPRAIGFDKLKGRLYAQNFESALITFLPSGIKQKEYKIIRRGNQVTQLSVDPHGGRVLIVTDKDLHWAALGGAKLISGPEENSETPMAGQKTEPESKPPTKNSTSKKGDEWRIYVLKDGRKIKGRKTIVTESTIHIKTESGKSISLSRKDIKVIKKVSE